MASLWISVKSNLAFRDFIGDVQSLSCESVHITLRVNVKALHRTKFSTKKQRTKLKYFTNNSEVVTMHKIDMKHPKCIVTQPLKPNFYLTKLHVEIFRKRYWFRR